MTDHIKVPDVAPVAQYVANGIQTIFTFPFPIFNETDMKVSANAGLVASGYTIIGTGETDGGTVTFATAPADGTIIRLERRLDIQRVTDFLEGGAFAAKSLNNELDYLVASVQQVQSDIAPMLRFPSSELSGNTALPERANRAGKALGFNENGDPVAYSVGTVVSGIGGYTATGSGAIARSIQDKCGEIVSVRDFGAVGDGIANDAPAIQAALAAHDIVFVPSGTYLIQSTIELTYGKKLFGAGNTSIIRAANQTFDAIRFPTGYCILHHLRIENGLTGLKFVGRDGPCIQNSIADVSIWDAQTGIQLDGYTDTKKPCYWNNFARVLVARPRINGVHLIKSGAGDTPNANRFHMVRVYSLSTPISANGIYVEAGKFNNAFVDCECDLTTTATSCVRLGPNSDKTIFVNLYTETNGGVYNVTLEAGSTETAIYNLLSSSAGAAIKDYSGGNYTAFNAGYPFKNNLKKTQISDVTANLYRHNTQFYSNAAAYTMTVDLTSSCCLVSSYNGTATVNLPNAGDAGGAVVTIKKTDLSANPVVINELSGTGPDGRTITLASRYDYITVVSNGANWWIVSHNLNPVNTMFYSAGGVFQPDLTRNFYIVSAFAAATEVRLPPANASNAIGRIVTIKKSDVSSNAVTVTESGGPGPDNGSVVLSATNKAVTVISNGASYYILSKY